MRIFRTTLFRFTVIYGVLFSAAVALLGIAGYRAIFDVSDAQTERIIDEEIVLLASVYAERSASGFREVIRQRVAWQDDSIYMLFVASTGVRLEGDLNSLPPQALAAGDDLFEFTYDGRRLNADDVVTGVASRTAVAKVRQFRPSEDADPAFIIFVGRDVTGREDLRSSLSRVITRIAFATIFMGFVIGLIFSFSLMRKVDAMNKTAKAIRAGDLAQRIPLTGAGDEMEQLASNLNAMLDQIERLMTGMKEVSDNIAHDLRSPLTRMRNRLTSAIEGDNQQKDQALQATLHEAENMITTFNELLSIARIESGEVTGTREPVNVAEIATEMVELYEPAALEAGFELDLETSPVPQVNGSRALISQAIANLLDNAIKYADGGKKIEINVRVDKKSNVYLGISDDGPGIPEDKRGHVLARYARLEESRTTPGSGLGLSLVSAIVRAHNGTLTLDSAFPEHTPTGLKVMIRFPRID